MILDPLYLWASLAINAPILAIVVLLAHYKVRRVAWKCRKRLGRKRLGFRPSSSSMGSALELLATFYRPSVVWVLEAKHDENAQLDDASDRDDPADPDTPLRLFHRQSRRIRQGKPLRSLVLRL